MDVKRKMSISDQIYSCYELVDKAEVLAYDGFYEESNMVWAKAADLSSRLLSDVDKTYFLDEELKFLKHIANFLKEE